jgi:exodeoxyribonuclease V alpha subunit
MVFLQGHGVSSAYAARILKTYGAGAIGIVREYPYRLALDIWGIGFRTADAIAQRLGIERTSPARAEAGVLHVLGELVDEGHTHAPEHELLAAAEKALEIGQEWIGPAIDRLVASGHMVREELGDRGDCLYLHGMWEAEDRAAQGIRRLLSSPAAPLAIDVDRALAWFEEAHRIGLAGQQREAIRAAVADKLVVVTGGPGTGKTTIVNAVLDILEKKGRRIALCAPTGRAAKRLAETTGRPAATIHRLLEWNPQSSRFDRGEERPLTTDVVIVDEASMVDTPLMASLVEAIPTSAQLVLVGDVDQLPSVGPGRVLHDVIASRSVRVVKLTEIFRQAAASQIVVAAHRVNRGELPDLAAHDGSDFFFIERDEPGDVLATVCEVVAERIPRRFGLDPLADVQVLSPMHRGEVGAQRLNTELQARLNPAREGVAEVTRGARTLRAGDRVLQLRNDYDKEVFNGDVGRIVEVVGDRSLVVEIDGRRIAYDAAELDQLVHAYALSVHKSQGSEYPAVVVPITTQHFMLLQRNLLYTALTRGKRLVVLVGSRKALFLAVKNDDTRQRWTWLGRRIAG